MPGRPTIALCMIVRDEAAVIGRCLDSVLPVIDHWIVCDTGSCDGTPAIVEARLAGISGTLHHRPWVDFGHNRTEALELARGHADYLLLIDADHELRVEGPRPAGGPDQYLLRHAGSLAYVIPRLVRGDRAWRYVGSTHEYLDAEGPITREVLEHWCIVDHADGGSRAQKFSRDRLLLERDLARHPGDARATFYLAQTLRDLGDDEAAIDMYARRVDLGGWDEELFYAQYQRGHLLAARDWDAAVPVLLDAWQRRPNRAEPLYELALGYRNRGGFHLAYEFASRGAELPIPDDLLFVHRDVYEHLVDFELAIAAFWTGRVDEALRLNERLLRDGVPDWLEPWVRANRQWCRHHLDGEPAPAPVVPSLDAVPTLADLAGRVAVHDVHVPSGNWSSFNPSIAADGDGYRMIVRSANYVLDDGRYHILDAGDTVRTRNHVLRLDRDGTVVDHDAMPDVIAGPRTFPSRVQGVEDCRLVELDGRWYVSATARDRNPDERCEVVLLQMDGAAVGAMRVLVSPTPDRHEKNWMPFVRDGALHFLYRCSPTTVLRHDGVTGEVEVVAEQPGPTSALGFRGGSQGVPSGDGWLFVVHEVGTTAAGAQRAYAHRLIHLDRALRVDALTPPFCFVRPGIEFCAGLTVRDDELLFSVGIDDRSAHVFRASQKRVLGLLEPCSP